MSGRSAEQEIAARLRECREHAGLEAEEVEKMLGLGPGWVTRFETASPLPSVDMLLVLLRTVGCEPDDFFSEFGLDDKEFESARQLRAEQDGDDLIVRFPYGKYDATYRLPNATEGEFGEVIDTLRRQLAPAATIGNEEEAAAIQSDAVAAAFMRAVELWPHANPSDLWYFVVHRAYLDPFNHPAANARLDLGQSWKRTAGWALEKVLVSQYGPFLEEHGVNLVILPRGKKEDLLAALALEDRLEADKVDVVLIGDTHDGPLFFGVVHVKASFAERRTDDVPMSQALIAAGYFSPLWTMDCKATPNATPYNRGELGQPATPGQPDRRSAKRKDIEDDGYFSSCFSYNRNTASTPAHHDGTSRVEVCDFRNPDDAFSRAVISAWQKSQGERD